MRDFLEFFGVCVGIVLGVAALLVVVILLFALPIQALIMEPGCNQKAQELGLPDGDYRLLSDECFLTLPSGEVVPASNYRLNQKVTK